MISVKGTWELQKSIMRKAVIIYIAAIPVMAVFCDFYGIFCGFTLGGMFSMLNFRLLALSVERAVTMPERKAAVHAVSGYCIRYFLTGAVILIALKSDYINTVATITGILLIKIIILVNNIVDSRGLIKKGFWDYR